MPSLIAESQAKEKARDRARTALRIFKLLSRRSASIACCVFAVLFVISTSARLSAQTSGSISGHVADATGAVIPGATVTLTNTGTNASRSTVTTGAGDYTFPDVPPAVYKVQVTRTGFKVATSQNLELQVSQSLRQDFTMAVGEVTQTVTVQSTGALLQTENASLGTVVENAAINELPLNGRNYLSLVALSSNVNTLSSASGQAGSRLGGDRSTQAISVGGQRIMFDYYTLDGVNNTDPDFNTYVGLPSLDGIAEFKVQTGVYSAEFGHEASQVNVVSKSGTNTFHGSMYDFIRNNIADANPYYFSSYTLTPPAKIYPYKWNDYGFELDGPIRIPHIYNGRDKFFFMVDDEWRKIRTVGQGTATVPTTAIAGGNFQGYQTFNKTTGQFVPVTIYNPASGDANGFGKQPFLNNQIPSAMIQGPSTVLLNYLGTSTAPYFGATGSTTPNYTYSTTAPQNRQSLTIRGDYVMSQKSQLSFRYSSGNEDILSTGLLGAGSKIITNYYQYMGSHTWTINPHIVNEARFGYTHFYNSTGLLSAFTNDVVDKVKIPGIAGGDPSTWGIPSVGFNNGVAGSTPNIWTSFGDLGGDGPYVITDPTWQIVDNLSWVKGKHSWRFGFEYNRQTFNQLGNQFSRGLFGVGPYASALQSGTPGHVTFSGGDSLADFLLGDVQTSSVAVQVADANYVRNVEAGYANDTYKLLPNLTISAGLRYELTPPWNDTFGNNFNIEIPQTPTLGTIGTTIASSMYPYYVRQGNCSPANVYQGLNVRWIANGPSPVCSNGLMPNGPLMDTHYLNFAPRFGISYSPTPAMVIRTGYGIFYTQDIGNAYFDMARNIAGRVSYTNADATGPNYGNSNLTWSNVSPAGGGGGVANLPASTTAFANAVSHKTSYTEQFLLDIQQQVGQNWSFEAGYQGAVSRHLYGFLNINQPTPVGYLPAADSKLTVAQRTPFPNMGGIQFVHDTGTANYNAFALKATRRFSHGFNAIGSYTWSKSLDDTSGIRNQGNDLLYPQNSFCIPCEYGPSAFDVRNRFVGSANYELPFGPGKLVNTNKLLGELVGGWQVGGILTHQTGGVASPQRGIDNAGIASPFGNFDRPNATGQSPYLKGSARTLNDWVNLGAYVSAPAGFFGSVQRGSFTGPGVTNLDASLHKNFVMPYNEHHAVSIRFEAFNALNHPNWNTPSLNISSSTFGRISGTAGMRQLQLAAKYQF
jgi:hypothetical protein